jgi:hypothetical protein
MLELQGFVARHGLALLETVDDRLADIQRLRERPGSRRHRMVRPYLGLYLSTTCSEAKVTARGYSSYRRNRISVLKARKSRRPK